MYLICINWSSSVEIKLYQCQWQSSRISSILWVPQKLWFKPQTENLKKKTAMSSVAAIATWALYSSDFYMAQPSWLQSASSTPISTAASAVRSPPSSPTSRADMTCKVLQLIQKWQFHNAKHRAKYWVKSIDVNQLIWLEVTSPTSCALKMDHQKGSRFFGHLLQSLQQ